MESSVVLLPTYNERATLPRMVRLLFLDDDSIARPDLFVRYGSILDNDAGLAAVGGPAVSPAATLGEAVSSALLSEPLVVGRSASRYRPRGRLRETDERELILCNLAIRRDVFLAVGGFNERLFPNEENEFLERLAHRGYRVAYDPRAVVERPAPRSLRQLLGKAYHYGRGRGAQARGGISNVTAIRIGLAGLAAATLLGGASVSLSGESATACALAAPYALYLAIVAGKLWFRRGAAGILAAAATPLVHATHAAGLLIGIFRPRRAPPGPVTVLTSREARS